MMDNCQMDIVTLFGGISKHQVFNQRKNGIKVNGDDDDNDNDNYHDSDADDGGGDNENEDENETRCWLLCLM